MGQKERIAKLPIGQANVIAKKGRPSKAKGCGRMLKGWDEMSVQKQVEAFNKPILCIVLRKVS